jgi:hypothetical protein
LITYKFRLVSREVDTPVGVKHRLDILHIGMYEKGKWVKWVNKDEFLKQAENKPLQFVETEVQP